MCLSCQQKIKPPLVRCLVCDKSSFLGQTHAACRNRDTALSGLLVAADYQVESVQKLIWHLKYSSVRDIGAILAMVLTDFFVSQNLLDYFGDAAVIPVPLHKKRLRRRGFNQAAVLAEDFAKRAGLQYLPILNRLKNTKSQIDLEKADRLQNVKGLFAALPSPSLGERKIILVDDVATTGATLNECAKALQTQQVKEIWGLVVARN